MNVPKIVIDTNLLVAAFFNKKSASFQIVEMARRGDVHVLWTREIRREAIHILRNVKAGKEFAQFFREDFQVKNPPKVRVVKEDPDDNKFLACAVGARANLVVSSDRALLDVKIFQGIPVMTPKDALKRLKHHD